MRRNATRWAQGIALWAALASAPALAGEQVALPAGEAAGSWRTALALAGLELADGSGDASIRIESTPTGWIVRATGAEGVVRSATVDAPTTAAEREDVALLARGLALAMGVAAPQVPAAAAPPLPPPPALAPPRPAPRPVAPPVPDPIAPPAAAEPAAPTESPWASLVGPPERTAPVRPPPRALLDLDPEPPARLRRRPRSAVELPPLQLSTGLATRPGASAAAAVALGVDFWGRGRTRLGWSVGLTSAHQLNVSDLDRTLQMLDVGLTATVSVGERFSFAPIAAISYRWYRQQFTAIDQHPMVVAGGVGTFTPLTVRRWDFSLDLAVLSDLGPTQLVLEDGSIHPLFPISPRAAIRVRFRGTGDPFAADSTSSD